MRNPPYIRRSQPPYPPLSALAVYHADRQTDKPVKWGCGGWATFAAICPHFRCLFAVPDVLSRGFLRHPNRPPGKRDQENTGKEKGACTPNLSQRACSQGVPQKYRDETKAVEKGRVEGQRGGQQGLACAWGQKEEGRAFHPTLLHLCWSAVSSWPVPHQHPQPNQRRRQVPTGCSQLG